MHSRVFVLSKGTDRITNEEAIFEMFNRNIADYAIEHVGEREKDIEWLLKAYPSIFKVEDDGSLSILLEGTKEYFEAKFEALRTLLKDATIDSIKKHEVSLFKLKNTIEDEFGFYFYTDEYGLETLDSFLEDMLCEYFGNTCGVPPTFLNDLGYLGTTWNVVQTIDYHC